MANLVKISDTGDMPSRSAALLATKETPQMTTVMSAATRGERRLFKRECFNVDKAQ